jgi:hypothetical protein
MYINAMDDSMCRQIIDIFTDGLALGLAQQFARYLIGYHLILERFTVNLPVNPDYVIAIACFNRFGMQAFRQAKHLALKLWNSAAIADLPQTPAHFFGRTG